MRVMKIKDEKEKKLTKCGPADYGGRDCVQTYCVCV